MLTKSHTIVGPKTNRGKPGFYKRILGILEKARDTAARSVNSAQVIAFWLVGREIVEEEQKGNGRAEYGRGLIRQLSKRMTKDLGPGSSPQNLAYMKQFYQTYPRLIKEGENFHAVSGNSFQHGEINLGLSWTHYRNLLRVDNPQGRSFYEIEATRNNWSARELERQINRLLYERLALSKDKKGLLRLAQKGQETSLLVMYSKTRS